MEHAVINACFMHKQHLFILFLALADVGVPVSGLMAATVGSGQRVEFGYTVIGDFCNITAGSGSLAVERKRTLIISDASSVGSYVGTRAPGTITIQSNLSSGGAIIIDPPRLSGGTAASASELKVGNGAYSVAPQILNLGADGSISKANLNVRFYTTGNGGRFANGTYGAMTTVTCTDNSQKL